MGIKAQNVNHVEINLILTPEEFVMFKQVFLSNVTVPTNWYNSDEEPEKYGKLQNFMDDVMSVVGPL